MTSKKDLLRRLTGMETPIFITIREDIIIDKCLRIINDSEDQIKDLNDKLTNHDKNKVVVDIGRA